MLLTGRRRGLSCARDSCARPVKHQRWRFHLPLVRAHFSRLPVHTGASVLKDWGAYKANLVFISCVFPAGSVPTFYREVYQIVCPSQEERIERDMFVKLLMKTSLPKQSLSLVSMHFFIFNCARVPESSVIQLCNAEILGNAMRYVHTIYARRHCVMLVTCHLYFV